VLQWARLCNAFLLEAKWFASGNLPKAEEYLKNAHVSTGLHVVLVHMFFLLGEGISKETVDLLDNNPSMISSIATILRLWDDLGSAQVIGLRTNLQPPTFSPKISHSLMHLIWIPPQHKITHHDVIFLVKTLMTLTFS
jgi:hypothetical protein